jgi:hypothetical protein
MANTKIPIELSSTPSIVDNGDATAITIDSSENVGIGTSTIDTSYSGYVGLELGAQAVINGNRTTSDTGVTSISQNGYLSSASGGSWKYKDSGKAALIQEIDDGTIRFSTTDTSGSADDALTWSERMRIDSSGQIGVGTTSPQRQFHIAGGSNTGLKISGNSSGSASGDGFDIFVRDDNSGVELVQRENTFMSFHTNNTEAMRINSSGNLLINSTTDNTGVSGGGIRQEIDSGETDGDKYYVAQGGGSNATPFVLEVVSQNLYDSGTTAMKVGRHSGNQRSISAGGTLNASGADYAEYMKKTDSCGTIAKGDVVGVDANGKLTKTFSDSINFVIKSTDPSYVGGDTWGSVDLNLTEEQYETERQKYDRIAFSGQVPVNITGSFNVGDYVYPQANGTEIQAVAKSTPTFEEYQLCVGKIWATEDDGRPLVAVKIG